MPGPRVTPFHGDSDLPEKVDVVVIGGGIIGVSTALELAERGQSVALCEKGGIGQEQSSRNWGWVRIAQRDPREVPLMAEAMRMWPGLDARIGRETGYRKAGITFTCANEKEIEENRRWNDLLTPYQIEGRILGRRELDDLFPDSDFKATGGYYTPEDGRAEPQLVTPAMAEAARERGAHVLTECAVRGVETAGGRISGVVTERGPIRCSAVVLAGGVWSNLFAGNIGVDFPQLKVLNSVLRTTPVAGGPESTLWHPDFAIRKREDGGYTIASGHENIVRIVPRTFRYAHLFLPALRQEWRSLRLRLDRSFLDEARIPRRWAMDEPSPFEQHRVLDPAPNQRLVDKAFARAKRAFPMLEQAQIAQSWGGYIDVTPDAIPVISPVESVPGFYLASGFSGHGFGIGPAAGKLMADLVTGAQPVVDPRAFRFSRFSDGSKIELATGFA